MLLTLTFELILWVTDGNLRHAQIEIARPEFSCH